MYGKCRKHYYACTQILLKNNGEFEYFQFYDVGGSNIVKGQWQSISDTVVLNTYEQQIDRLDTVIESTIQNQKNHDLHLLLQEIIILILLKLKVLI